MLRPGRGHRHLARYLPSQGDVGFLDYHQVRLFDFPRWAEPLREELRDNAERIAAEAGLQIEFIRTLKAFRKEARIKEILAERGDHPGLVHIFSAMESCPSYRPWHDKSTHRTFLKPTAGKCLHYYFYFIDEQFGLCYVRVPTWAPFRLQVYFNAHSWLARQLRQAGVAFEMLDNAFVSIADPGKAQELADALSAPMLHERLALWAQGSVRFCATSARATTGASCRQSTPPTWSFAAKPNSSRSTRRSCAPAVHIIKAEHVATFLARKLHQYLPGRARQRLLHPYPGHPHPPSHGASQHQALRLAPV